MMELVPVVVFLVFFAPAVMLGVTLNWLLFEGMPISSVRRAWSEIL